MKQHSLEHLCCPECNADLDWHDKLSPGQDKILLHCKDCSKDFYGYSDYVDFMGGRSLDYSGHWERVIRSLYARIYTPATNAMFLFCGGVGNAKREVLEELEIRDNQMVLETGVGAAENFYLLNKKADNLRFYGNDIQKQMLDHAIRNLKKWNIKANLYKSDAQYLPFKDNSFDVVFHLGSINLFPDKKRAIDEMIRVAKPGTKIVIADESEKAEKLISIFTGVNPDATPPLDYIPEEMLQPEFKTIWRGYGYLIKFRKPYKSEQRSVKKQTFSELVAR